MDTFIKVLVPIILANIILVLVLARFIDGAVLITITALLILLCFVFVLYSFFLGSLESMKWTTMAISVIIGTTIGLLISSLKKYKCLSHSYFLKDYFVE